ncbi:MAG: LysR substrate-binding domain-containing protein [Bacteroidales bacterium]|nr:LysR substrate-binding domain-containing protein [Bacteroidales bacterium]
MEIPLYYERFIAYFSPDEPDKERKLIALHMPTDHLWILQEGHCVRNQVFNFCGTSAEFNHIYEAGSIDTLIKIVDRNGGYTVIPELHLPFLTPTQRENIRNIDSPTAVREISILIRKDYIPKRLIDGRLKKFAIRL